MQKPTVNNSTYFLNGVLISRRKSVTRICSPCRKVYASPKNVRPARLKPADSVESIAIPTNRPQICAIMVSAIATIQHAAIYPLIRYKASRNRLSGIDLMPNREMLMRIEMLSKFS